jgi:hypothetical protein
MGILLVMEREGKDIGKLVDTLLANEIDKFPRK